jgi:hypothetical protein
MSKQLEQLRSNIRSIISEIKSKKKRKLKKEETTTANVAGYDTPRAFNPDGTHKKDWVKHMASLTGYQSVNENRFHQLRLDQKRTPNQKIGVGIREIRKQITEIEKFLEWYGKIKQENSMKGEQFWKRTNKHIYRIKERLHGIRKNISTLKK